MFFFMKELREASCLKIIGEARGWPKGRGTPQSKCHQWQKFVKKALFLYFQFLLASLRTLVLAYNSN